jgi:hypothetical protein
VGFYSVGGRGAGSIATGDPQALLWNPHSTVRLYVVDFSWAFTGTAAEALLFQRATARGTPITTTTPDIDNAWERDKAPPSGALLDLDWSTIPTTDASILWRFSVGAGQAGGGTSAVDRLFGWPGIVVPPGTGLQLSSAASGVAAGNITYTWYEES